MAPSTPPGTAGGGGHCRGSRVPYFRGGSRCAPRIVLRSPGGRGCPPCLLVEGDVCAPARELGVPLPAEEAGPWVTCGLAVLGTCWGGPVLPQCPTSPPHLHPSSPKRFSGPFPLHVPLSGEGGVSSCCFPLPFGGDWTPPSRLCLLGGLAALGPYLQRDARRVNPLPPPKSGEGALLAPLVHRSAALPLVQLITLGGARPYPSLVPSAAPCLGGLCFERAAWPQG